MYIKIYQIERTASEDYHSFVVLGQLKKVQETATVDSSLYNLVYQGHVDLINPADVLRSFSLAPPDDYYAKPVGAGDIMEVMGFNHFSVYYFVNLFGYTKVDFDPQKAKENIPAPQDKPTKKPVVREEFTFNATLKLSLAIGEVDCLMSSILEDTAYWYRFAEAVPQPIGECVEEQIARGGVIRFYLDDEEHYDLTIAKLLSGLSQWLEKEPDYSVLSGDCLDIWSIGKQDADHILQYALFNEIKYD